MTIDSIIKGCKKGDGEVIIHLGDLEFGSYDLCSAISLSLIEGGEDTTLKIRPQRGSSSSSYTIYHRRCSQY